MHITDGTDPDFLRLVTLLDEELSGRYGELQKQYNPLNSTAGIKSAVVLYEGGEPAACGAFKVTDEDTVEIKRVFVRPEFRKCGLASEVMLTLEKAAREAGYKLAVLETGVKQLEAISLYKKLGFTVTENYGPYAGNANSVCMKKELV